MVWVIIIGHRTAWAEVVPPNRKASYPNPGYPCKGIIMDFGGIHRPGSRGRTTVSQTRWVVHYSGWLVGFWAARTPATQAIPLGRLVEFREVLWDPRIHLDQMVLTAESQVVLLGPRIHLYQTALQAAARRVVLQLGRSRRRPAKNRQPCPRPRPIPRAPDERGFAFPSRPRDCDDVRPRDAAARCVVKLRTRCRPAACTTGWPGSAATRSPRSRNVWPWCSNCQHVGRVHLNSRDRLAVGPRYYKYSVGDYQTR